MSEKMYKISIITRTEKFDELREELLRIGVQGLTVTNVEGCGVQQGTDLIIRGVRKRLHVVPKIQIDICVCTVPVETVIDVALKTLQTGDFGDGKIFVSEVTQVVRIRTGERDKEALKNPEDD